MSGTFDSSIVRDLYKDARGMRPGANWMEQWNLATDDEKQVIWDALCIELDHELDRERQAQTAAFDWFNERVAEMQQRGANNTVTAIRWLFDAEGLEEFDLRCGPGYVAQHFGFNDQNPLRDEIIQAIAETAKKI